MYINTEGRIEPEILKNKPLPYLDLEKVYGLFWLLHRGRSFNMSGAEPIKLSEIFYLFQLYAIVDKRTKNDYIEFFRCLDETFFDFLAEKEKKKPKKDK